MNDLEEIKRIIKNFVNEAEQTKAQIQELENQRMQLANQRNEKKQDNMNYWATDINALGQKISELGNESQKLQNKLNFKFNEVKKIVDLTIDNAITDKIRKVRKMEEDKQEIEEEISSQSGKNIEYEIRKQEFFERFGRVPELSVKAQKEEEKQDEQNSFFKQKIHEIEGYIINMEKGLVEFATVKREFKNKNWDYIFEKTNAEEKETIQNIETVEETVKLPLVEEFQVEEQEPIEYINVQEFEPIPNIEIGEIEIDSVSETKQDKKQETEVISEQEQSDEVEILARAIVEEIIAEQTRSKEKLNEVKTVELEPKEKLKINPITTKIKKENITLSNIIAKEEDREIVYKALVSNGEEIKIYPTQEIKNILLNEKEYKNEIKELVMDYAMGEHKTFDNVAIRKMDPTICMELEVFAKRYNFDERNLIYNYTMSFSKKCFDEIDTIVPITYNLAYLKNTNLSNKEKKVISKICKNASTNENIDIIGGITGFSKIKYMFKRLFNLKNIDALPEGKCE